jgi:hypothetical protein
LTETEVEAAIKGRRRRNRVKKMATKSLDDEVDGGYVA